MTQNPLMPKSFRAFFTAASHLSRPFFVKRFFAAALCLRDTTFPCLFFVRSAFDNPPTVFAFVPRNTELLARLPRAILLFFIAFFFMAFFIVFSWPFSLFFSWPFSLFFSWPFSWILPYL